MIMGHRSLAETQPNDLLSPVKEGAEQRQPALVNIVAFHTSLRIMLHLQFIWCLGDN